VIESLEWDKLAVVVEDMIKVDMAKEVEGVAKKDLLTLQVVLLLLKILCRMMVLITFWLLKMLHKVPVHLQDIM